MYVLYAEDTQSLREQSRLFDQCMEPLLQCLDAAYQAGRVSADLAEVGQYLQVCRWPFRKLEYSFALNILLDCLRPGDRYLDAGCGVTPLAHVLARSGVRVDACDTDRCLIDRLREIDFTAIFGTSVGYAVHDLTSLGYPDATFDAISCISVLEHIPAPLDQAAVCELLRVLKPGGILVVTVDFAPLSGSGRLRILPRSARRAASLARSGQIREIGQGVVRKLQARQQVRNGSARHARSAHQCFQIEHLEQDILPNLVGQPVASGLPFATDLRSVTAADARQFWELEPGLFDVQGRRPVLPVGHIVRKSIG